MYSYTGVIAVILLAVNISAAVVNGQVFYQDKCYNVPVVKNFSPNKIAGFWAPVYYINVGHPCGIYQFSPLNNGSFVMNLYVGKDIGNATALTDDDIDGQYLFNKVSNGVYKSAPSAVDHTFRFVAFKKDKYVILSACSSGRSAKKGNGAMILTKNGSLPRNYIKKAKRVLRKKYPKKVLNNVLSCYDLPPHHNRNDHPSPSEFLGSFF